MKIKGVEYELVKGKCNNCAFLGSTYGGCDLDVGRMKDEESCLSKGNTDKIYKKKSK